MACLHINILIRIIICPFAREVLVAEPKLPCATCAKKTMQAGKLYHLDHIPTLYFVLFLFGNLQEATHEASVDEVSCNILVSRCRPGRGEADEAGASGMDEVSLKEGVHKASGRSERLFNFRSCSRTSELTVPSKGKF